MWLLLLLIVSCTAINIHDCHDERINGMNLKLCPGIDGHRVDFHDFTGENEVRLKDNKIYRNHGEFVALYNGNTLYVGKESYDLSKWRELKNNFK
jgi:hypothetical protein